MEWQRELPKLTASECFEIGRQEKLKKLAKIVLSNCSDPKRTYTFDYDYFEDF